RVPAECRRNVIAAQEHLARHLRVTRLVRSKQRHLAQTKKIKRDDDEKEENVDSLGKRLRIQVYSAPNPVTGFTRFFRINKLPHNVKDSSHRRRQSRAATRTNSRDSRRRRRVEIRFRLRSERGNSPLDQQ